MSMRWVAFVLGMAALAVLAAGCGGSEDGGDEAEAAAITKAELIKRGDAICKSAEGEVERQAEAFAKEEEVDVENPTDEQSEEVITEYFLPSLSTQAEELRELGAPEGEEDEVDAILTALEEGTEQLEVDPGALLGGAENPLEEASDLAVAYGFTECGQ